MSPRRFSRPAALAVAAFATLAVVGASAAPVATPATAVTHWNAIAVSTILNLPPRAGGAPQAAQVEVAMVQGAVYDAVNAIGPKRHRPYVLKRRFGATSSKEAAAATAAYEVLANIVATVP